MSRLHPTFAASLLATNLSTTLPIAVGTLVAAIGCPVPSPGSAEGEDPGGPEVIFSARAPICMRGQILENLVRAGSLRL
jgi:hypothetical protein